MSDPNVSIKFNSDSSAAIAANNALIESLKKLEAQHTAVKNSFKGGLAPSTRGGGSGSGRGAGGGPPGGPPIIPPSTLGEVLAVDNAVTNLGSSLAAVAGQAAAFTGLALGAATLGDEIRKTIMAVADLDYAMSAVAAVGGLDKSGAEFQRLTDVVVEMGAKTRYTSTQAAEGLKELVAAGYQTTDATKILGDTLNLASTENMSLAGASEIVVAGMQAMGLGVDQSTRFVDVLARAANASTASVTDMGESLKFVAPVAAAMGISLEETSSVLAILANNGIRGGMAGRGLSSVMAKLVAPTKDAQAALKELGIRASDINPRIVGVEAALKKLSALDQPELVKLFGVENLDVSNIIARNASAFASMNTAMRSAGVTAKGMAETRMDNLTGDFDELGAAVDALRIALGGGEFYKSLRTEVQSFTQFLNENRDAIVQNIEKVGSLALTLAQVVIAYKSIQAASLVGHLVDSAASWAKNTTNVDADTAALSRNAAAAKGARIGAGIGGAAGAYAGSKLAPENAGMLEKAAYSLVGSAIGSVLGSSIGKALGATLTATVLPAIAAFGVKAAAVVVAPVVAAVAGAAAVIATIAAAGVIAWNYMADASKDAFDAISDYASAAVSTSRRMVANAKNEQELAKAKKLIDQQILNVNEQIKDSIKNGGEYSEQQVKNLQITRDQLYAIYNNAEKINQRKQDQLAAERVIAEHNEKARSVEEQRARLSAEIAENLRQQVEAAVEFNKAYDARRDIAVSGLDASAQVEAQGEDFAKARSEAEQIRKNLDEAAKSATSVANELTEGSKATTLNGILSDEGNAKRLAAMPVEKRQLAINQQLDPRVKPTDIEPPKGGIVEFMQQPIAAPKVTDPFVKAPTIAFDKAPAFTDMASIASYYKKVLEEARASGNVTLQAEVEGYMADLDKAVRASVEAGIKIQQALKQRDEKVRSLLPTERQEVMADLDFKNSLKAAEDARAQIDAILAEQGMEPLVDPKQEFKNAEDIANYYRRTQNALTKAGKVDLLTKEPFNKLTDAMNKNDSSAKEQDRVKSVQDRSAIQSKEAELAKANANNDQRRVAQLETELALMKEQQSIAAALNLTGKDGQAEAKKLAAGKVSDDLKVRLNEQMAEMNPLQNKPKQLGSGATAMNQLFGRKSNDGLIEQAREQTKYLKELVKLAGIKESIKFVATLA
jgi:TP901 family phage tail tape measure protein